MEDYYDFAGAILQIEHENDNVFRYIDNEIKAYKTEKGAPAFFVKIKKKRTEIPEKAVRTTVLDGQSIYSYGKQMLFIDKEKRYVIAFNPTQKEIIANYVEDGGELLKMLRLLIKWIVIISAQESGSLYLHASAARYKGKNIIFCGDSHCGKSSCLLRLVQNGAKAISDDSVLFNGENLIPFTMNTTIDGDLEKRFGINSGEFDISGYMDHNLEYGKADIVIFLKVWNNSTSEIREVEYKHALLNLINIYKKEIPMISTIFDKSLWEGSGAVFKKYASLLENTKCFEFYAGFDEEEVRKSLLEFLDRS